MAEEATDVKQQAVTQEPAAQAPSPKETKAPEADPILDALKDEPTEQAKEDKKDAIPAKQDKAQKVAESKDVADDPNISPTPEDTSKDEPKTKADDRKTQLNTEIRDLVAKRNALRAEVEKKNAEVYQPATEQQLVDDGLSATDAKVEALRQEIELDKYNSQVAEAQLTIEHESSRVMNDFAMFNPDSEEYKPEIASQAANLFEKNLIKDPNTGEVIGSNLSVYELYKTFADTYNASKVEGQIKGQKATEKMLANADTTSSAGPPSKAKDPILDILKSDDY